MTREGAPLVDFGRTANDYARHRPGFPVAFFDHVAGLGLGVAGQRIVDLGTGTGTLARGFAERGASVVGIDPSDKMLVEAGELARTEGLAVEWVQAKAEETGLAGDAFDVVCAGQCWHWFDRARAAAECRRVLRAGGRALIAYFCYLPDAGTVAEATEEVILRYNPRWTMAGSDGRYPQWTDDLRDAGFHDVDTFEFDLPITFTHESWRGRFRACNGVLVLPPDAITAFDTELAKLLEERFPEPLVVRHRIFGIVGTRP
ncbi:MAG: methyltransferase domain-containing protein [Polyangiaceae bacterium]|nr:methyltransferase domain-containing protein [Polyangiaceae bacterium]